jgi:hypothetical protein
MTAWKNDVYPVLLCPEPSLIEAVRSAARDFCNETHLWILALDRISVVANTQAYALAMPTAWLTLAEIVIVDNVKYKQTGDTDDQFVTLDPVSENQKDLHDSGNWKFRTALHPYRRKHNRTPCNGCPKAHAGSYRCSNLSLRRSQGLHYSWRFGPFI